VTVGHLVYVDIDGRLSGVSARLRYGDTGHVGQLPASAKLDESRTSSETHRDFRPVAIMVFFPLELSDDVGGGRGELISHSIKC
jgi:hypothetical protein